MEAAIAINQEVSGLLGQQLAGVALAAPTTSHIQAMAEPVEDVVVLDSLQREYGPTWGPGWAYPASFTSHAPATPPLNA